MGVVGASPGSAFGTGIRTGGTAPDRDVGGASRSAHRGVQGGGGRGGPRLPGRRHVHRPLRRRRCDGGGLLEQTRQLHPLGRKDQDRRTQSHRARRADRSPRPAGQLRRRDWRRCRTSPSGGVQVGARCAGHGGRQAVGADGGVVEGGDPAPLHGAAAGRLHRTPGDSDRQRRSGDRAVGVPGPRQRRRR